MNNETSNAGPLERPVGLVDGATTPGTQGFGFSVGKQENIHISGRGWPMVSETYFAHPETEEEKLIVELGLALNNMIEFIKLMPDFMHPLFHTNIKETSFYNHALTTHQKCELYEKKSFLRSSSEFNAAVISASTK